MSLDYPNVSVSCVFVCLLQLATLLISVVPKDSISEFCSIPSVPFPTSSFSGTINDCYFAENNQSEMETLK